MSHKREHRRVVLVRCMQCLEVDITMDAPKALNFIPGMCLVAGVVEAPEVEGLWIATAGAEAGASSGPSLLRLGNARTVRRVE